MCRTDKAILRALANAPGVFLITISGDDDHPATPAASIPLTVSAVAELVMQQIPVLTMTTRITSLINAAAVLSAVGGFAPYQYYLANKPAYLSVNIDSGAVDILRGADAPDTLVLQARGEDDSDPRLTAFVSLTVVVVDPPSLRIRLLSPDFLAPVAQRATLGSLIVEGGFTLTAYNFVANGDDVFVSVDADGLVLLSAAQTGLYLLTLIVADNHPLVDNATLKITARVSPSFELPPPTVIFTITTRAGTSPQRTTLQAVRGFAPIRYGIAGAASAFMSIDAASGELGHFGIAPSLAATITGTVFAADSSRPRLTAVVLFTVEVVEPQPLSAEIEVGALTLSVGGVASIATLSASGGYVVNDYHYGATIDGRGLSMTANIISLAGLSAGLHTIVAVVNDDHSDKAIVFLLTASAVFAARLPDTFYDGIATLVDGASPSRQYR